MKAYRYEDVRYAGSEEGDRGFLRVELREYDVTKQTAKGFWLDLGFGGKRFVLSGARKKFACLSKTDAATSFKARKNRQISIYKARLADAQEALRQISY